MTVHQLLLAAKSVETEGALLQLGRQAVEVDGPTLQRVFAEHNLVPALSPSDWVIENGWVTSESFFRSLGFSTVESLDIDQREGASHAFDLNEHKLPKGLQSKFDAIFDGGTLEHIYDVPQALSNSLRMLRRPGVFWHIGPMNNYVDHGFYQFSPTLWFDWAHFHSMQVLVSNSVHRSVLPGLSKLGALHPLNEGTLGEVGALNAQPQMHFFVARANTEWFPTSHAIQQNYYSESFDRSGHDPWVGEGESFLVLGSRIRKIRVLKPLSRLNRMRIWARDHIRHPH